MDLPSRNIKMKLNTTMYLCEVKMKLLSIEIPKRKYVKIESTILISNSSCFFN